MGDRLPLHQRCMRYQKPDTSVKRYAVFDIETNGLGGSFLAGGWQVEGEQEVTFFTDFGCLFAAMLCKKNRGVIWYMHNGYEYDFKYLLGYLETECHGVVVECACRGSRIVRVKLKHSKQTVELRDSFHLFQKSLKEVTKLYSTEEKGYLDFTKVVYDHSNQVHRDYLRRDVCSLLEAVRRLDAIIYDTFGQHLRATLPATSLACFKTTIPTERLIWRQRQEVEEFCRAGYYGGMVFLTTLREQHDQMHLDFNAMYAASMLCYGAPVGCAAYTTHFVDEMSGFYRVRINGEHVLFPFIPSRLREGGVYYPREWTETIIDSDTYRYARSVGYEIELIEGYVFDHDPDIFRPFLEKCQAIELAHKDERDKVDAIGATMKSLRNSCYGIFGLKPDGGTTLRYTDEETHSPAIDEQTGEMLFHYEEIEEIIQAGYMQPGWAAWITAHARLILAQAVYAAGPANVVYGDTDSLVVTELGMKRAIKKGTITVGRKYGDVKIEARYQSFRAFAPKNYQFIKADGRSGGKANGVPRKRWSFVGQRYKRPVTLRGVMRSTRTMLKQDTGMVLDVQHRGYSDIGQSAAWEACADGSVMPRRYKK